MQNDRTGKKYPGVSKSVIHRITNILDLFNCKQSWAFIVIWQFVHVFFPTQYQCILKINNALLCVCSEINTTESNVNLKKILILKKKDHST